MSDDFTFSYHDDDDSFEGALGKYVHDVDDKEQEKFDKETLDFIPLIDELTEEFVLPDYELPSVHPKEIECLEYLKQRMPTRINEPIPFEDLRSHMYRCECAFGKSANNITGYNYGRRRVKGDVTTMGRFHIVNTLRRLWRAGLIRRFYKKKIKWGKDPKRPEWKPWGVHYMLTPNVEK